MCILLPVEIDGIFKPNFIPDSFWDNMDNMDNLLFKAFEEIDGMIKPSFIPDSFWDNMDNLHFKSVKSVEEVEEVEEIKVEEVEDKDRLCKLFASITDVHPHTQPDKYSENKMSNQGTQYLIKMDTIRSAIKNTKCNQYSYVYTDCETTTYYYYRTINDHHMIIGIKLDSVGYGIKYGTKVLSETDLLKESIEFKI
jgi:hypothetical protein